MTWKQVSEAHRRLSREQGYVVKGWGGRIPVALVYPNSYYLGMSSLGVQTVYRLFNAHDSVVCERAFISEGSPQMPGADNEGWTGNGRLGRGRKASEAEADTPISLESQRPLSDFAIVAFSVSYEMDYFNLVSALKRSGIPLLSSERDERHPLVMAGGPCITANPEPMAPFLDVAVMGEGELIIPAITQVLENTRGERRQQVLEQLAKAPGVYVPALGNPVTRQWLKDLDSYNTTSVVLTPDTSLGDMYLMEVTRGCAWGCRFCLAGYLFRPMRARSLPVLLDAAREGLRHRKRLGLVGAAVSDYPWIDELVARLREMGANLSASSLRLRPLSRALVSALLETGAHTLTFAPEAGSDRLREIINKGVSEEDIFNGVEYTAQFHVGRLKLYFMVGLPGETDEDIEALVRLCLACRERLDAVSPGTELVVSLTPFVPKAGTPFQWEAMAPVEALMGRLGRIKRALRRSRIHVRHESPEWSAVQGMLARGDRRLAGALALIKDSSLSSWKKALEEAGVDGRAYLEGSAPLSPMPWSHIDQDLPQGLLGRQQSKAFGVAESSLECPPAGSNSDVSPAGQINSMDISGNLKRV